MKRLSALILILLLCMTFRAGTASFSETAVITPARIDAETAEVGENTGYSLYMQDEADLLTAEEEQQLLGVMEGLLPHANVAFFSTENGSGSASQKALDYRDNTLHLSRQIPLILLIIDIGSRNIYLFSQGEVESIVTRSNATAITEEAAEYLKRQNYFLGAEKAFDLTKDLLVTRTVPSTMRLTAALIAAPALGLMAAAIVMLFSSRLRIASHTETQPMNQGKLRYSTDVRIIEKKHVRTILERIPSVSGGSSCSSCGSSHSSREFSHSSGGSSRHFSGSSYRHSSGGSSRHSSGSSYRHSSGGSSGRSSGGSSGRSSCGSGGGSRF